MKTTIASRTMTTMRPIIHCLQSGRSSRAGLCETGDERKVSHTRRGGNATAGGLQEAPRHIDPIIPEILAFAVKRSISAWVCCMNPKNTVIIYLESSIAASERLRISLFEFRECLLNGTLCFLALSNK